MKKLILLSTFFFSISTNALPNCPLDQSLRYDNCYGAYTDSDGDKYVGAWKDNKMNGQGTYTWADGDKYVGAWKDNERHGQGTFTDSDGDKYVGAWKDNKMNGQGTYTWADGKKQRGYYVNGEYVPDICEDMGLSKGTSGYEQCVLKLIDKL